MFSFGWSELALTAIIIVIVVGPKEIPNLLKQIGIFTKSIKKISREFKSSLNEIAEDSELNNIKNSVTDIKKSLEPSNAIKEQIDSIKKTTNLFEKEIKDLNNTENKKTK